MEGGDEMGYKVKRGKVSNDYSIKEMLFRFFKRFVVVLIILSLMVVMGYFLLQFFYDRFPVFAVAVDDISTFIKGFYSENGIWATLGLLVFICIGVWALGEELKRKERRKGAMKQMTK